jgi:hypothetical protein
MVGRSEEGKRLAGQIERLATNDGEGGGGAWRFSLADYLAACDGEGGWAPAAAAPPLV